MRMRRIAKFLYLQFLFRTGLLRWARARVAKSGTIVLTLHRVLPDEQYDPARLEPGMVVRASTFQRLLEYITHNCKPVLPGEVITRPAGEISRKPQIVLTFDDGWKDNFETVFPLGQKYQAPFTIFICPEMIDRQQGFWTTTVNNLWWAAQDAGKLDVFRSLRAGLANGSAAALIANLKHVDAKQRETLIARLQDALAPYTAKAASSQDQLLSWKDVNEMARDGVAFGSHTNTHPILTDISASDAARELAESKNAIQAKLNACDWFAYPNGDWSQTVRELAKQAGYQAAFANSPGIWSGAHSDRFSIPRINLWEGSLVGMDGQFSRIALEYAIFWKAYRAQR